jgi:hypothetical protein
MDTRTLLLAALLGTATTAAPATAAAQDRSDPAADGEIVDEQGRRCRRDEGPVLRSGPTWTCVDAEGRRERVRVRPRPRPEGGAR